MTEMITETVTTTTETEVTPKGVTETTQVEHEYNPDVHRHCTCEECIEWEEDVTHEIATLRERVAELENGGRMPSDTSETSDKPAPEPKESETQVKVTPDVKEADETKDESKEDKPKRSSKRTAGVFF